VWPVVMLKVAEPVLKSHMINVPPRSADSNMPATFMTCRGGVSGRCGGMCGRAVWSALHLCWCTMWGAWLRGAWLGDAWLGGARAAWMGEVCPARLTIGSNFSFANFQVLTPVSSPPEKRNSPAPRHAGYHPLTRRLRCHGTRCAVRTARPEASTRYGHGSSAPGQAALRGTAPALRTCQHRCSPPCARQ
jgi:hypothetical protein